MGGVKKIMTESAASSSWNSCEPIDLSCAVAPRGAHSDNVPGCHDSKEPLDLSMTPSRPQCQYMDYGGPYGSLPSETNGYHSGYESSDSQYDTTRAWSPNYQPCLYPGLPAYYPPPGYCHDYGRPRSVEFSRNWHQPEQSLGQYNYTSYNRKVQHRKNPGYTQTDQRQRSPLHPRPDDRRILSGDFYRPNEQVSSVTESNYSRNVAYNSGGGFCYSQNALPFTSASLSYGSSKLGDRRRIDTPKAPSPDHRPRTAKSDGSPEVYISSNTLCAGGCVVSAQDTPAQQILNDLPVTQPIHIPLHLLTPVSPRGEGQSPSNSVHSKSDLNNSEHSNKEIVDLNKVKIEVDK